MYAGALFAFGEMLTYSVTAVADVLCLHDQDNDNAQAVIRGARDLGMRLVLASALYDWPREPGKCRETPDAAARRCPELLRSVDGDPLVAVHLAPHRPARRLAGR